MLNDVTRWAALLPKVTTTTERVGFGPQVKSGDTVEIAYVTTLDDGTEVDRSKLLQPFRFEVGSGQVIMGLNQGVIGMRPNEKRRIVIPSSLAYGAKGRPGIPPNTPLVMTVTLVRIL